MPVTADKVVVELEARLDRYNAGVRNSERQFARAMSSMENASTRASRAIVTNIRGFVGAFASIQGARLAKELLDANTQIQNSLRVTGLQGEELTRVYERLFDSAQRNAAPFESLVQLYRRVALSQRELGVSTNEILQFTDRISAALRVQGVSASEASGPLLQLAQAMGAGVVRAEEFNSIIEGVPVIAQAAAAGLEEAGGSVAKLRKLVTDGKVSSEAFFRAFEAGSASLATTASTMDLTIGQSLTQLSNALVRFAGQVDQSFSVSGAASSAIQELTRSIDLLSKAMADGETDVAKFVNMLSEGASQTWEFIRANNILALAARALNASMGVTDNSPFSAVEINARKDATDRLTKAMWERAQATKAVKEAENPAQSRIDQAFAAVTPARVSLSDFELPGDDKKQRENAYQRELRQIQERTALLQTELSVLGQSQFVRDKALATQELENAAIQAKIPLNATVNAQIDEAATKYAEMAEKVRQAETQQQALNDLMQTFGDIAADTFVGLIDGTKSWNDALKETLSTLARLFAQAAFTGGGPFGQLFGLSGQNGAVGGLFGALFGGKRALGGSVQQNRSYLVGERGPELMVPGQSGTIVPNHRINAAMSGGSGMGGGPTITMVNDFRGNDASTRAYIDNRLKVLEAQIAMAPQTTSQVWNRSRPGLRPGAA